jgi:hypothetical protein
MNKILTITAILMTAMFASGVLADSLRLENKDPTTWVANTGDGIYADLTFDVVGPTFKGTLTTHNLQNIDYALIYYPDQDPRFSVWGGTGGKVIATFNSNVAGLAIDTELGMNLPNTGDWNIAPSPDYCLNHNGFDSYAHCKGAKIWIVPKSDLTSDDSLPLDAWNPTTYLFETDLITYVDSDLPGGTGQITLDPRTCGLSATNFGFTAIVPKMDSPVTSEEESSTLYNTGNSPTTSLGISGDYWYGSLYATKGDGYWMPIGATEWYAVSTWYTLTSINNGMGKQVSPGSPITVYFRLTVPTGQASDSYTQAITFTAGCD